MLRHPPRLSLFQQSRLFVGTGIHRFRLHLFKYLRTQLSRGYWATTGKDGRRRLINACIKGLARRRSQGIEKTGSICGDFACIKPCVLIQTHHSYRVPAADRPIMCPSGNVVHFRSGKRIRMSVLSHSVAANRQFGGGYAGGNKQRL